MKQTELYYLTIRLVLHSWNIMLIPDTLPENNPLAGQINSNKEISFSVYDLTHSDCTVLPLSWDFNVIIEYKR